MAFKASGQVCDGALEMQCRNFAALERRPAKRVNGECATHMFIPLLLSVEILDALSGARLTNSH